jgi:uncharacterized membrane protein YfcA
MLNSLAVSLLVGTLLGFLSGLGIGGGSLLILWLTLAKNMPVTDARAINLLFFIPSALIACMFRWQQGRLEVRKILPAILAGSIAAALFAWFGSQWDTQMLRKAFGLLLLFTGLRELFYKPRKA